MLYEVVVMFKFMDGIRTCDHSENPMSSPFVWYFIYALLVVPKLDIFSVI